MLLMYCHKVSLQRALLLKQLRSLNDPHALGEDILNYKTLPHRMGAKICTAVLAFPHPNPIPHKLKVGPPA